MLEFGAHIQTIEPARNDVGMAYDYRRYDYIGIGRRRELLIENLAPGQQLFFTET